VAEEFYRGLMRCYHAQGRLAEAMQAYRRCRDVLGATLDVKPADETERIFRDVRGAAALAPDRLPTLAPAGWPASDSGPVRLVTRPWRRGLLLAVAVVVAVGAAAGAWQGYWIAGRSTAPGVVRERESTRPDQRPSIAVLAFENLSGDPEQEYFSDGMADSIITRLAGLQQLFVISRNSSFLFKGKAVGAREAGLKLGATYVLEGSVQKADGRVRINAQLIETATDKHVWAEQYDRELRDVFAVQDEITRRVVAELGQKFIWGKWNRTAIESTRNVEAYDLYLRARSLAYATERARSFRAIELLERAIALDPEYARAMGLMGNIYVELARRGEIDRPDEAYRRAEQLATRALAIDPSDPSALVLMGHVLSQRGDHERAIALSRQALAVEPNNYSMQFRLAWQLWLDGQVDEALQLITQAMRVWPMPPPGFRQVEAWINLHAGNYETAERIFRTFADPKNEVNFINRQGQLGLILSLLHQDRVGEAREEAEKFRQFPDFPFRLFVASWRRTGLRDTQRLERHLALFRKVGLEE
jgi:TolB-like protein/Tfp pilus assembly protein PilF